MSLETIFSKLGWNTLGSKTTCDYPECNNRVDYSKPTDNMISVEIKHPGTQVTRYLWFCCKEHRDKTFSMWAELIGLQIKIF